MKKLSTFAAIAIPFLLSFVRGDEETCRLYGKIVDATSGEIVRGTQVQLFINGEVISAHEAEEGTYEFNVSPQDTYELTVMANDYNPFSSGMIVPKAVGLTRRDVALEKPPHFLQIHKNGVVTDVLDLGKIESPDTYTVHLFNSGAQTLRFRTEKNRRWITSVTPSNDEIAPEQTSSIAVSIDPTKLEAGATTGKVLIISDQGNAILKINAIGNYPVVRMLPTVDLFPDYFEGLISFAGDHTYIDRGFCYSTTNARPTINDNPISANDYGGEFIYRDIWDSTRNFPWIGIGNWEDQVCQKWYVRAYLKYDNKEVPVIYSDNVEDFILWESLCPTCP